ncbi:hypothetical protein BS47DRAFT_324042 [Hydnum rufescens UP504]|uniref:Uncharacterized protein n=1 Tax=Hydnum rufescens UP504 TaxID=1448309 RepID=A0A9P6B748_9AGAM|nr:hypothetical protein BS47DRAFT_324042 [Hydnum rufescens UP504]
MICHSTRLAFAHSLPVLPRPPLFLEMPVAGPSAASGTSSSATVNSGTRINHRPNEPGYTWRSGAMHGALGPSLFLTITWLFLFFSFPKPALLASLQNALSRLVWILSEIQFAALQPLYFSPLRTWRMGASTPQRLPGPPNESVSLSRQSGWPDNASWTPSQKFRATFTRASMHLYLSRDVFLIHELFPEGGRRPTDKTRRYMRCSLSPIRNDLLQSEYGNHLTLLLRDWLSLPGLHYGSLFNSSRMSQYSRLGSSS